VTFSPFLVATTIASSMNARSSSLNNIVKRSRAAAPRSNFPFFCVLGSRSERVAMISAMTPFTNCRHIVVMLS